VVEQGFDISLDGNTLFMISTDDLNQLKFLEIQSSDGSVIRGFKSNDLYVDSTISMVTSEFSDETAFFSVYGLTSSENGVCRFISSSTTNFD
jgi:hypothetical protein